MLRSYKTVLVLPINFYRTRIKEPVIITRIESSSNLLIFLVCFFVLTSLHASGAFFACCSTSNVLNLSQIISACSMSSEIQHVQLRFALFQHLENPTTLNLSRLVNFRNKAVSIYLALMIFNFIPANSASEARCWT